MGDTCYMSLDFKTTDTEKVKEVFDYINGDQWADEVEICEEGFFTTIAFHEINYGGDEITEILANADLSFMGYHEGGDTYDRMEFACVNGDKTEVDKDVGGCLFVRVFGPGEIDIEGMAKINKYYEKTKQVQAYFNE